MSDLAKWLDQKKKVYGNDAYVVVMLMIIAIN